MYIRIIKKILIIYLIIITATCSKKIAQPSPFILSNNPLTIKIEEQNHRFCLALKAEFSNNYDTLNARDYWQCRLSLTRNHIAGNYNEEINKDIINPAFNRLLSEIEVKLGNIPETRLTRENKKIDNLHHNQCIDFGYEVETTNQIKIDKYFFCRKILMEKGKLVPPFGNKEYEKYPNKTYDLKFIIDNRIDKNIKKFQDAKKKYPTCIKYHLESIDFKNCTKSEDNSRQCYNKIPLQKFQKEADEKIICQKKSYLRFPDEFLKEDLEEELEKRKRNKNTDFYNQHNFDSLGIDENLFYGNIDDALKNQEQELSKKLLSDSEINSKKGLYTRFELTKLRQKFISSCVFEAEEQIKKYVARLNFECEELKKFNLIGYD